MRSTLVVAMIVVGSTGLARADDPPMYECHALSADTKISVQFKPDTSIRDLVTWALGFTCKNIVLTSEAERAAPRVTVIAPKPMTLENINGYALDSADKALEVYSKVHDAAKLDVEIVRRGKPVTLTFAIK